MSTTETRFTRTDYEQLPEGFPCELIEGQFVKEPAPVFDHRRIVSRIVLLLGQRIGAERVVPAPIDIVLDDFNVLQPDVAVWTAAPQRGVRRVPIPTIAVEVLSPSSARRDRSQKTRLYIAAGVSEVWLIEPDTGVIEVHTFEGVTKHDADEIVTSAAIPEFSTGGRDLVR